MDKKEAIGLGIIVLTAIITMILVTNPLTQEQISTLDYVEVSDYWEITEPTTLFALNVSQEQYWSTANGDFICWTEGDGVHETYDVYAYNITDESIVAVSNSTGHDEYEQDNYGDVVVWTDDRDGYSDIYYKDLSVNETVRVTWTETDNEYNPRIWGDFITFQRNYEDVLYYDIISNNTFTVMEGDSVYPDIHEDYIVFEKHIGFDPEIWLYEIGSGNEAVQISQDGDYVFWPKVFGDRVIWGIYYDPGWTTQVYDIEADNYYDFLPTGDIDDEGIIYASLYENYMVGEDYYANPGSGEVALVDLNFELFDESVVILTNSTDWVYYPDISSTNIAWTTENITTGDLNIYFVEYSVAEDEVERVFTTETTYHTGWINFTIILALTLIAFGIYYANQEYHEKTGR